MVELETAYNFETSPVAEQIENTLHTPTRFLIQGLFSYGEETLQ